MKYPAALVPVLALVLFGCPSIEQVATPVFDPGGGTYSAPQNVTITCDTTDATIYYTTNGADPTAAAGTEYDGGSIVVASTATLKAFATRSGMTDSGIATATYTLPVRVATPTFDPDGGDYDETQNVTISCATAGATIYYTSSGTDPTAAAGTEYDGGTIVVASTTTLKAFATRSGMADSAVATATYAIPEQVAAPVILPPPGVYFDTVLMYTSISCATAGATIMYTLNGDPPSRTSGTEWVEPADGWLYLHEWEALALKAMAYKDGLRDSPVVEAGIVKDPGGNAQLRVENNTSTVTITKFYLKLRSESDWGVNQYYRPSMVLPPDYTQPVNSLAPGWMELRVENDSGTFMREYRDIPLVDSGSTTVSVE